jgi:general secretion pathway protein J
MIGANRGFTLLEVLLAISVLGMVMAMLSLSLTGAARIVEATEREEALYTMAQTAMRRISEDVAAALWCREVPFIGKTAVDDGHRLDSLGFCSQAHLVFNPERQQPGPAVISYHLVPDEEKNELYRLLRSDEPLLPGRPPSEREAGEAPPAFVLADNLRSLQLTYFDHQGQEFDSWEVADDESNPEQKSTLPAAVHCILEFRVDAEPEASRIFSTRIIVPVGVNSGN